jgi:Na+-transporting NADH:ubiquinone oxidoreductase subunit NqrD
LVQCGGAKGFTLLAPCPDCGIGENAEACNRGENPMEKVFLWIGRAAGIIGVVLCAVAVLTRLGGALWLSGFQVGTLLQVGMAAMLLGCLALLASITERLRARG